MTGRGTNRKQVCENMKSACKDVDNAAMGTAGVYFFHAMKNYDMLAEIRRHREMAANGAADAQL
nr:hypothetical protein [uncultured Agathobaculum sp.]